MPITDHAFEADMKLPTRCIKCGDPATSHLHTTAVRWCVYSPDGRLLPEPIGDSAEDAVACFCALSEMSREQFLTDGYTVGPFAAMN